MSSFFISDIEFIVYILDNSVSSFGGVQLYFILQLCFLLALIPEINFLFCLSKTPLSVVIFSYHNTGLIEIKFIWRSFDVLEMMTKILNSSP